MKNYFLSMLTLMSTFASAQQLPLVYSSENTGISTPKPVLPERDNLPVVKTLTDPLEWSDGTGRISDFKEWAHRRNEIATKIQHYEIGTKPSVNPDDIKATLDGDSLFVTVTANGNSLTLKAKIDYPEVGRAPYALMIGTSHISLPGELFEGKPIARLTYNERQVNGYSQFRGNLDKNSYGFVHLYPELIDNGAYSMWAWGLSRIIDGLEKLGTETTKIDMQHIGVTGCSYAGKMALFCGAFDERVALTIAQEPGGGGAAAWRVSHTLNGVEDLDKTDYHWFKESLRTDFHGDSVYQLPYDHHELCAMVFPRALLVLGNTDYQWLADESAYVSVKAAAKVWETFGVADRIGLSILGGHPHCQLHKDQYEEVTRFIDKFLLGKNVDTSNIWKADMFQDKVDVEKWIKE